MPPTPDKRDGYDRREEGSGGCLAHSGFTTKINMLLILSSIATMLIGAAFPMLISIKADVATNTEKVIHVQKHVDNVEKRVLSLEHEIQ